MKNYILIAFLLFVVKLGFAQNPNRTFESIDFENKVLEIKVDDGIYRIIPYSERIIETTFIPNGETFNPNSHAVVLTPNPVKTELHETDDTWELKTSGISVAIQKQPFQISYHYRSEPVISEKNG